MLKSALFQFLAALPHLILPNTCLLCGQSSGGALALCNPCLADLPRVALPCTQCATSLAASTLRCGMCLRTQPAYDTTLALFAYQYPLSRLITRLKFNHQLVNAHVLGTLLAEKISTHYQNLPLPDALLPVPLHPERLRQRGFNQALEIARPLARHLRLPLLTTALLRVKPTLPQADLSALERRRNLKGAFKLKAPLNVQHIALIDDVVTTGNTIHEISKILKRSGVQRVDVWCCARTVLGNVRSGL